MKCKKQVRKTQVKSVVR